MKVKLRAIEQTEQRLFGRRKNAGESENRESVTLYVYMFKCCCPLLRSNALSSCCVCVCVYRFVSQRERLLHNIHKHLAEVQVPFASIFFLVYIFRYSKHIFFYISGWFGLMLRFRTTTASI